MPNAKRACRRVSSIVNEPKLPRGTDHTTTRRSGRKRRNARQLKPLHSGELKADTPPRSTGRLQEPHRGRRGSTSSRPGACSRGGRVGVSRNIRSTNVPAVMAAGWWVAAQRSIGWSKAPRCRCWPSMRSKEGLGRVSQDQEVGVKGSPSGDAGRASGAPCAAGRSWACSRPSWLRKAYLQ
jgi:hypothetical protein